MHLTPDIIRSLAVEIDDFGHEMRVGKILRSIPKVGPVEHAGTYSDPVTGLARQFDYRFRIETGNRAALCAVECKNIGAKPIVVCGAARETEDSYHDLIVVNPPGPMEHGKGYFDMYWSKTKRFHSRDSAYSPGSFVGKSTFRIGIKNRGQAKQEFVVEPDGDVYERWAQALASCHDLCQLAGAGAGHRKTHPNHYLVLPILVVSDSSLWTIEYSSDGIPEREPIQVDQCELFVGRKIPVLEGHLGHSHHIQISHLHIFTLKGLEVFCRAVGTGGTPERLNGGNDISFWGKYFPSIDPIITR